jgi:hypothetical protein
MRGPAQRQEVFGFDCRSDDLDVRLGPKETAQAVSEQALALLYRNLKHERAFLPKPPWTAKSHRWSCLLDQSPDHSPYHSPYHSPILAPQPYCNSSRGAGNDQVRECSDVLTAFFRRAPTHYF